MPPITPKEVAKKKKKDSLPEEVFDVWNELIARNWDGSSAEITISEAKAALRQHFSVVESRYFDVEDVYREAGWKVEVDRPGYCESYETTYEFKK